MDLTSECDRPGTAALPVLCAAQFLVVTNITLVAIVLPAVRADLGFADGSIQWVVTAYALVFGCSLMISGRLADLCGHRRVFALGLWVFALGSLGCGVAWHPVVLLASRGVQGLGAASVAAAALAMLIAMTAHGRARSRALGWWSASQAVGGATGWLLGGVLSEGIGWPWLFLGNVPLAVACALLTPAVLPDTRGRARGLDLPGGLLVTVAVFLFVFGLTEYGEQGDAWLGTLSLVAGVLALGGFVLAERRARDPVVPLAALRQRSLVTGTVVIGLINAINTPVLTLCVLYVHGALGLRPSLSGLLFVPFNLAVIAGSTAAARLLGGRPDARFAVMASAVACISAGAAVLMFLPSTDAFLVPLLCAFVALGVGGGGASVAANIEGTAGVTGERGGVASGLLNTATELGVAFGMAVFVTIGSGQAGMTPAFGAAAATGVALILGLRLAARRPVRVTADADH